MRAGAVNPQQRRYSDYAASWTRYLCACESVLPPEDITMSSILRMIEIHKILNRTFKTYNITISKYIFFGEIFNIFFGLRQRLIYYKKNKLVRNEVFPGRLIPKINKLSVELPFK